MGSIHSWGRDSKATVDGVAAMIKAPYYLELRADDDEKDVQVSWDDRVAHPEFVVAPNLHDSRSNSVAGANVRRLLGDIPVAVMVVGRKRRERLDMCHWLIENSYLPMFPRFAPNHAGGPRAIPLTRHQLLHEMRPILDREPGWIFVLHGFLPQHEKVAEDYISTTDNSWEILYA